MANYGPPLLYWQCPSTRRSETGLSRGVRMHPTQPQMYFNPFIPYLSPEIDYNHTQYFQHEFEACFEKSKISDADIRAEIVAGDEARELSPYAARVMKLPNGKILPAYVPLLSDLNGYLHKGVGVFVKWLYENHVFDEGELVPKPIVPIFDLKPSFEAEITPTYTLPTELRQIMFGANTNSIHVMKVLTRIASIQINVYSGVTRKRSIRYFRISVCGNVDMVGPPAPVFPERGHVVLWNARDVQRDSFVENFKSIYDSYNPFLIVITEARARYFQKYDVVRRVCGNYEIQISGDCGAGGAVIMWNKVARPQIVTRSSSMKSLNLAAEVLPGPAVAPPSPNSDREGRSPGSDDDYDYIGNWLVNSGLLDDPSIHDEGWC